LKTLFIDSTRKSLSVALAADSKLLFVSNVNSYSKHSNFLMNEIKNILEKGKISIYEIDDIVVLNGPGSFTGIRVGVTIAKTICWTLSKKLYQMSNLKALELCSDGYVISAITDNKTNGYVRIDGKDYYANINDDIFNIENKKINIVCMEESEFIDMILDRLKEKNEVNLHIIDDYNYTKIIDAAHRDGDINPHLADAVYIKRIDAEK